MRTLSYDHLKNVLIVIVNLLHVLSSEMLIIHQLISCLYLSKKTFQKNLNILRKEMIMTHLFVSEKSLKFSSILMNEFVIIKTFNFIVNIIIFFLKYLNSLFIKRLFKLIKKISHWGWIDEKIDNCWFSKLDEFV